MVVLSLDRPLSFVSLHFLMHTHLDCIPCFIRQALDSARAVTSDENIVAGSLRRVLEAAARFDPALTPPEMGQIIHQIIREETNDPDPYREIKERSIETALALAPMVEKKIKASSCPFETAVRFAIAGNIMDFALKSAWDPARIDDSFEKAARHPLDVNMVGALEERIAGAASVLFLADNAGETVFDRLLIETFPGDAPVTYAVKAGPIINDATRADASASGLERVAAVVDNGTDAPGTVLSRCSAAFLGLFDTADVVLAKGQGNFETLISAPREVFLLTQIKCPVIGDMFGFRVGDWIVTSTAVARTTR